MGPNVLAPIDRFDIEAGFSNEFRRLLAKVRKHLETANVKSIMFTSAMLSEGKSTTASFLAVTAARHGGLKTLLIDSDLRRPSLHRMFGLERGHGLCDILTEGYAPRDAIVSTSFTKLDLLTAGSQSHNPSSVFDAPAIGLMIEDLKFFYDLILIDAPPLMPVSDPLLLSSKVDRMILVVKAGETDRAVVRKAVDSLGDSRDKIIGVVMNNVTNSLPYYYDYRYYGYEYGPSEKGDKKSRPDRRPRQARRPRPRRDISSEAVERNQKS